MKKMLSILLILLLCFGMAVLIQMLDKPPRVYAAEVSEETQVPAAGVESYLADAIDELLKGLDLSGLDEEFSGYSFFQGKGSARDRILELITGDYRVSGAELLTELLNSFFGGMGGFAAYFAFLVAIALLISIVKSIKPAHMSQGLSNLTYFVCFAIAVGIVGGLFIEVYKSIVTVTESLERQSEVVFPIILTLMTASGGNASVAVFQPQVAFLAKTMTYVVRNLLLPIIVLLLVFNVIGSLSEDNKFDKTKQFLKSSFKWITGLTVVIFNFFVTAQGIAASVYDGISIKALKYALGNSVPLVGGLVSGGFDIVRASMILIKNAVGSFALIAVLLQVITPILKIGALTLFLRLSAAVIEPLSDKRLSGFLSSVADTCGYLTASVAVCASSYFITVLLMICSLGGAL